MKSVQELINEVMTLAVRVNEKTETTVFVDFSGHINEFEICLYETGWRVNASVSYRSVASIDEPDCRRPLSGMIRKLKGILKYNFVEES